MAKSALASALHSNGATVAGRPAASLPEPVSSEPAAPQATPAKAQPSRKDTKPITVHYPAEVRRQLKTLAAEEGRTMDDMVAEALNLLFARFRKAEIAPRRSTSQQS